MLLVFESCRAEWHFHSIWKIYIKLLPDSYSRSSLLRSRSWKIAIIVAETICFFGEHKWKYLTEVWVFLCIIETPVHESRAFFWMAMQIYVKRNFSSRFFNLAQIFFDIANFSMKFRMRILPFPIQIMAWERSSIVTMNHSIRIEERNYLYNELWT